MVCPNNSSKISNQPLIRACTSPVTLTHSANNLDFMFDNNLTIYAFLNRYLLYLCSSLSHPLTSVVLDTLLTSNCLHNRNNSYSIKSRPLPLSTWILLEWKSPDSNHSWIVYKTPLREHITPTLKKLQFSLILKSVVASSPYSLTAFAFEIASPWLAHLQYLNNKYQTALFAMLPLYSRTNHLQHHFEVFQLSTHQRITNGLSTLLSQIIPFFPKLNTSKSRTHLNGLNNRSYNSIIINNPTKSYQDLDFQALSL